MYTHNFENMTPNHRIERGDLAISILRAIASHPQPVLPSERLIVLAVDADQTALDVRSNLDGVDGVLEFEYLVGLGGSGCVTLSMGTDDFTVTHTRGNRVETNVLEFVTLDKIINVGDRPFLSILHPAEWMVPGTAPNTYHISPLFRPRHIAPGISWRQSLQSSGWHMLGVPYPDHFSGDYPHERVDMNPNLNTACSHDTHGSVVLDVLSSEFNAYNESLDNIIAALYGTDVPIEVMASKRELITKWCLGNKYLIEESTLLSK